MPPTTGTKPQPPAASQKRQATTLPLLSSPSKAQRTEVVPADNSGADASATPRGDKPITPWGVEAPSVAPTIPWIDSNSDNPPTPTEVCGLIKQLAAHVVTVLPDFFKEHKDALAQAGLDLGATPPQKPAHEYDALQLPVADTAPVTSEHSVFGMRRVCVLDDLGWLVGGVNSGWLAGWWVGRCVWGGRRAIGFNTSELHCL